MAIQIAEKLLSPLAQKALNNAKNKSQFLRDALEYYVRRDITESSNDMELKQDIKDIKGLLYKLSLQSGNMEAAITKEVVFSAVSTVDKNTRTKVEVKDIPVNVEIESVENKESNNVKYGSNLSNEEKLAIENALDASFDNF